VICKSNETCKNEKCEVDCPPAPCQEDEGKCISSKDELGGTYKKCIKNEKGCLEWSQDRTCGDKEICDKGQCTAYTCPTPECVEGKTQCDGQSAFKTCVKNKLGCIVWSTSTSCKKDEQCRTSLGKCSVCNPKEVKACYSGDAATKGVGLCKAGKQACKEDGSGFGPCVGEVVPSKDICDGKDNNCDGAVDEDFKTLGDVCNVGKGACAASGKMVCKKDGSAVECSVKAGTATKEVCDGKDNDCDGAVDEDFKTLGDACNVGVGECKDSGKLVCKADKTGVECSVKPKKSSDEICDGKDNDCDGKTDENMARQCFSGSKGCTKGPNGIYKCVGVCSYGIQNCVNAKWTKCDKEVLADIEKCNGKDDDCDGQVDDGNPSGGNNCTVAGKKADRAKGTTACTGGKVICKQVNLPKKETCNGKDDDCDGNIDNGLKTYKYYPDADKDKYGDKKAVAKVLCQSTPPAGYVTNNSDCNDKSSAIKPGARDICDGVDNDCDGATDEGNTVYNWYRDADGDSYGDKSVIFRGCLRSSTTVCTGTNACRSKVGYVTNNRDCCDKDRNARPGQTSYYSSRNACGSFDYNCDGRSSPSKTTCSCSRSTRYTRSGYADSYRTGESWARWYTRSSITSTYTNPTTCEFKLSTYIQPSSNTSRKCSASWCSRKALPVCIENSSCTRYCTLYASYAKRTWNPKYGRGYYIMWYRRNYRSGCAYRLDGKTAQCGDTVQSAGSLLSQPVYRTSGTSQSSAMSTCSGGRCRNTCQSRINYSFSADNSTYGYTAPSGSYKLPCR
jgi:hypothetical protein